MVTDMTTAQLRRKYATLAADCVRQVNAIRRAAGRRDVYTIAEFNADTLEDIRRKGGPARPAPVQWVFAARSRRRELSA